MAKKFSAKENSAYVDRRVAVIYGELNEALIHLQVIAELASERAYNRAIEIKNECANMPRERLLEEFAFTQAAREIQGLSYDHLKAALVKASQGLGLLNVVGQQAISDQASEKAMNRHAPNHDAKQLVFKWCDEHHHKYPRNMDGMATAITESKPLLVEQQWRTVRDWITVWAKDRKLRSAGRPDSN